MRSPPVIAMLAAAALGVAAASGLLLFALPFVVLALLLLTGRYVGEERILAFRRAMRVRRRRAPRRRWGAARPAVARSLLARAPRTLRGPPALLTT